MALYVVEILGTNSLASKCMVDETTTLVAYPDGTRGSGIVMAPAPLKNPPDGYFPELDDKPALFESKELAERVGLACRWNNQRYLVKPARGHLRAFGKVVNGSEVRTLCY